MQEMAILDSYFGANQHFNNTVAEAEPMVQPNGMADDF